MSPSSPQPWKSAPAPAAITRVTGGASDDTPPLHTLLGDFVRRWQSGERPLVEELLAQHPSLGDQAVLLKLIQEEQRLRHQYGTPLPREAYQRRFPRWATQLDILLAQEATPRDQPSAIGLPCAGDRLGEFELLAELGRGAEGVVFVARQAALADRPVVLKITPCRGQEHLSLARLQHTNIVPLYNVHEDPRHLRILVMPYFGGTTLAQVLDVLRPLPPAQRTGQQLMDVLAQVEARSAAHCDVQGPARQLLARLSWTRALCWMGAALADALDYAHQHGLVHLDVKPSNVLLANDGQPMLLDFHLARPPLRPGDAMPSIIGGTLAYMPREQHEAMAAVREGRATKLPLDGRSDVYALGATLYHALGGPLPYLPGDSPPLHRLNPDVTLGLSDIVERSLSADTRLRYPDAASLAADLRRHLADQPLAGVPNRSVRERWLKWRKRRPYSFMLVLTLVAVLGAACAVGLIIRDGVRERRQLARAALDEGRAHLEKHPSLARQSLRRGLDLLEGQVFSGSLRGELLAEDRRAAAAEQAAEQRRGVEELRSLVERSRFLYASDIASRPNMEAEATRCRRAWEQRRRLLDVPVNPKRVREDLLELAILSADLEVRLAQDEAAARRSALHLLDEAEQLLGSGPILPRERQRHALALGQWEVAERAAQEAEKAPLQTAWHHYALARLLMRQPPLFLGGGPASLSGSALLTGLNETVVGVLLERACALEPGGFWPNFARGQHAHRQGRHGEAITAFSVCIGAAPRQPASLFNRAMAHATLGQETAALRDFASALRLDSSLVRRRAVLHYNLAVSCLGRDDRPAARRHLAAALEADSLHGASRSLLRRLSSP